MDPPDPSSIPLPILYGLTFGSSPQAGPAAIHVQDAGHSPTVNASLQIAAIVWKVANIVLACLMASRIIYSSTRHRAENKDRKHNKQWRLLTFRIPTEDVFPFILATALAVQNALFLYAESRDIDGSRTAIQDVDECTKTSTSTLVWAGMTIPSFPILRKHH